MIFESFGYTPHLNRIPTSRITGEDILSYGEDNLYCDRMRETLLLSPLAKQSAAILSSFIRGDGFENGEVEVNRRGETANDVLRHIADDYSVYGGFALLVNSTGVGVAQEIQHIPFEFVRLGLPRQDGSITYCKVSNNWEGINSEQLPSPNVNATRYKLFNGSQSAANETLSSGRGTVFYYSPRKFEYPLASIDAIVETCQADYEVQVFELSNITNGFLSMSIFKYPTSGSSEEEEEKIRKKLNPLKGARGANSVIVAGIDEDSEARDLIEQIPANNNDVLFVNTVRNIKERILQNFGMPPALAGVLPEGSIFTSQELADSYTYMNLKTADIRNTFERQIEKLGMNFGKIVPNSFESSQMLDTTTNEQQEDDTTGQDVVDEG